MKQNFLKLFCFHIVMEVWYRNLLLYGKF